MSRSGLYFILTGLLLASAPAQATPIVQAQLAGPKRVRPARVAVPAIKVPGGIVQITGKKLRVGQSRFTKRGPADPFVDIRPDGKVAVYGTTVSVPTHGSHTYLEFDSMKTFLAGGKFETRKLDLHPALTGKEQAWDFLPHRWKDGTEVLYAGVMTPTARRTKHAHWPDDNWTRRIHAFVQDKAGVWKKQPRAVFSHVDRDTPASMMGHTYGHHFKTFERETPSGRVEETWLFHEEVSGTIQTPNGPRLKTEIFARKMIDKFTASEEKVKILGVGDPAQFGRRASGDHLVEGPRPFEAKIAGETYHFVTFSGADYAGDGYDIHFAYRRGDPIGPYTPMTRPGEGGAELEHYAEALKARHGLSWVGRAHVIESEDGTHYAVFHGVSKAVHPDADYTGKTPQKLASFHRNVYAVPMTFERGADGAPVIKLIADPRLEPASASQASN